MRQTSPEKKREGRPTEKAIRWNLQQVSREFDTHREHLERRRRALGVEPGPDGCFSSADVKKLLFGDKEAETIGKLAAERRKLEIECARLEGELGRVSDFDYFLEVIYVPIRQEVCSSGMPVEVIERVLGRMIEAAQKNWNVELKSLGDRKK